MPYFSFVDWKFRVCCVNVATMTKIVKWDCSILIVKKKVLWPGAVCARCGPGISGGWRNLGPGHRDRPTSSSGSLWGKTDPKSQFSISNFFSERPQSTQNRILRRLGALREISTDGKLRFGIRFVPKGSGRTFGPALVSWP